MSRRLLAAVTTTAALIVALAGCASAAPTGAAAEHVTVTDAWVKAADDGMSAAFGELRNSGSTEVTLVSVATPASPDVELHETVADDTGSMVMRPVDGGFTLPAGGSRQLAPGGDHIMLMSLPKPLVAGGETEFTLTFDDGSTLTVTAPIKDYAGANETYDGDDEHAGHGG